MRRPRRPRSSPPRSLLAAALAVALSGVAGVGCAPLAAPSGVAGLPAKGAKGAGGTSSGAAGKPAAPGASSGAAKPGAGPLVPASPLSPDAGASPTPAATGANGPVAAIDDPAVQDPATDAATDTATSAGSSGGSGGGGRRVPVSPANLSLAHKAMVTGLVSSLLGISRLGFTKEQATLISDNGGGILSNNAAGIVSNNAAGIISNHAAGLISDKGGNLVSDQGLGYRVMQAATPGLGGTIATTPAADEALALDYLYPDDSHLLGFYTPATFSPDNPAIRRVGVAPSGKGLGQVLRQINVAWPSHLPRDFDDRSLQAGADGRIYYQGRAHLTAAADAAIETVSMPPGSTRWDDAVSGVRIDVNRFDASFLTDHADYAFDFRSVGLVETGELTKLRRRPDGQVVLNLMRPEDLGDVSARVENALGSLVFTKTVVKTDAGQIHTYVLKDGRTLRFDRASGGKLLGKLLVDGQEEADATLERRSGAHIFSITFPEDTAHPIVIGYGSLGAPDHPETTAASWLVSTAAGAGTAGSADGTGAQARFVSLAGLAASRVNPNRLYACDKGANAIVALDVAPNGTVSASRYAGTGAAGLGNGDRGSARFNAPLGLAVGPDDALYVADSGNHVIRRIGPDGVVTTYAGSGALGGADGAAGSASFVMPAGLALDPAGRLYVSDAAVHTIRRVGAGGTVGGAVETIAGAFGVSGLVDGDGGVARFNMPAGLALTAAGDLLVADAVNQSLRRLGTDGRVQTVAGNPDPNTNGIDGAPLSSALMNVRAIAIGPSGQAYLATDNVRVWRADGKIGTYAGAHASLHLDGLHTSAGFTDINGLAFGPNDVLYVSDGTRLRAITPHHAPRP